MAIANISTVTHRTTACATGNDELGCPTQEDRVTNQDEHTRADSNSSMRNQQQDPLVSLTHAD